MGATLLIFVAVITWVVTFISGRRFGVLGLALAAGALLSSLWAKPLIEIVQASHLPVASISVAGLVSAGLVLAPAILLLFSGPAYRTKRGRLVGATLFALFTLVLIVEPLGSAVPLEGVSRQIFEVITAYRLQFVTAGIVIALLDVLAIHTTKAHLPKGKH